MFISAIFSSIMNFLINYINKTRVPKIDTIEAVTMRAFFLIIGTTFQMRKDNV